MKPKYLTILLILIIFLPSCKKPLDEVWSYKGHKSLVRSAAFTPDGNMVYTGSVYTAPGDSIIMFNSSSGKIIRKYDNVLGVEYLRYWEKEKSLVAGMDKKFCTIRQSKPELDDRRCYPIISKKGDFNATTASLLGFQKDKIIDRWDLTSGAPIEKKLLTRGTGQWAQFVNEGYIVFSEDQLAYYSGPDFKNESILKKDPAIYKYHTVSNCGNRLLLSSQGGKLSLYNLKEAPLQMISRPQCRITSSSYSSSCSFIYIGDDKGFLRVYNTGLSKLLSMKKVLDSPVELIKPDPTGRYVLVSGINNTIKMVYAYKEK